MRNFTTRSGRMLLLLASLTAPLRAQRGTVRVERLFSPALGVSKHYLVYLPPSYAREPARRFPVAYYLHGLTGNEADWVTLGAIDVVADSLVAQGMPELVIVMPDGDDGWYTNGVAPQGPAECSVDSLRSRVAPTYCVRVPRYDAYVARDLVAHVDSTYRTLADRAHRGVAGLSMGGYGAITLALVYPEVFSAAASHSGVLSPLYGGPHPFAPPVRYVASNDSLRAGWGGMWARISPAFGTDTADWWKRDPGRLAAGLVGSGRSLPALFVDVGRDDGLADENRAFDAELTRLGIRHVYAEWPGRHTWDYWHAHVGESLRWLAGAIAR